MSRYLLPDLVCRKAETPAGSIFKINPEMQTGNKRKIWAKVKKGIIFVMSWINYCFPQQSLGKYTNILQLNSFFSLKTPRRKNRKIQKKIFETFNFRIHRLTQAVGFDLPIRPPPQECDNLQPIFLKLSAIISIKKSVIITSPTTRKKVWWISPIF